MSWRRDDPGYGPSPDPAAAAEEHFYQQSLMDGPDEPPWECDTCRDQGIIVESDHDPKCSESDGKLCASLCPVPHEYPCPDCSAPSSLTPRPAVELSDEDVEENPF